VKVQTHNLETQPSLMEKVAAIMQGSEEFYAKINIGDLFLPFFSLWKEKRLDINFILHAHACEAL
jgi:hypothetical protein